MTVQIAPPREELSPRGGYTVAAIVVVGCGIIITAILAKTWTADESHGSFLYISGIGSILGVIVGAATYVRWENAKGQRRIQSNQQTLATELHEVKKAVTRLADHRSVDLTEAMNALRKVAGEMQEQTLLGQVMVAEKFSNRLADQALTASATAVEELTKRMDSLGDAVTELKERHLVEVQEAYELGRLTGPGRDGGAAV
jgi:hypothetical protein